jgi:hypothetical protein
VAAMSRAAASTGLRPLYAWVDVLARASLYVARYVIRRGKKRHLGFSHLRLRQQCWPLLGYGDGIRAPRLWFLVPQARVIMQAIEEK